MNGHWEAAVEAGARAHEHRTRRRTLAARLSGHQRWWFDAPGVIECECGAKVAGSQKLPYEAVAAHQADVALAWMDEQGYVRLTPIVEGESGHVDCDDTECDHEPHIPTFDRQRNVVRRYSLTPKDES
jgi:hypothetical protein